MSELAYSLTGEAFEVPGAAVAWRVRKLKAKGAPEVVYGRDGIPLILPIDADMDDLRREARGEGKYRVDALDEYNRPIPGCPAGYVCIYDGEPVVEPLAPSARKPVVTGNSADQALVEAMRIQAGLAQSIVERFAMMLESSATLISAAQNAGMPQRLPRFFLDVGEETKKDDEGDVEEAVPEEVPAEPAARSGLYAILEKVAAASAPAFINAIINGKIKIPGGLGALIDCRRAVQADHGAPAAATDIPGDGPAPGHRDPAPATDEPAASSSVRSAPPASHAGSNAPADMPAADEVTVEVDASAPAMPDDLPTIDADTMQRFTSILQALTLDEQMHAQALAAELSPAELRIWIHQLKCMPLEAAVAKIRAVLGTAHHEVAHTQQEGGEGAPPSSAKQGPGTGAVS